MIQAFQALADAPAQATLVVDDTGRVVDWSDEAEMLFGWSRDEVIGEHLNATIVPPFYRSALAHGVESLRSTGQGRLIGRLVEISALRRDGSEFPVEVLVTQVDTASGRPGFTAVVRDISRRQRSDQLRNMQLSVSRSLIESAVLSAVLPQVLETVARTLGCEVATVWLPEQPSGTMRLRHSWHAAISGMGDLVASSANVPLPQADVVRRVWQAGLPFVVQAGSPHGNPLLAAAEAAGVRWMAAFPLVLAQPQPGALVLFARENLPVDEDLLAAMGSIGSQVGQALARSQAEQELRESERQYRILFDGTPTPVLVFDTETRRFLAVNDAAIATYGFSLDEFLAMRLEDIQLPDADGEAPGYLAGDGGVRRRPAQVAFGPYRHRTEDGHVIDVEITARSEEFQGRPATLALVHDITERLALERDLWRQAFHDPLTGLANRSLFMERLEQALRREDLTELGCAVLLLDLDDFKNLNDSRGHHAGDQLLRAVAERLRQTMRPGEIVARLGGDEFAVLIEDAVAVDAEAAAERVLVALRTPFLVEGKELVVRASLGIAFATGAGAGEEVLRNADLAMYTAKASGKSRFEVFLPRMHQATLERVALEQELRGALARGELTVHYQPQVELATGRVTGAEALVRWRHPTRGLLLPDTFIPLAEDTGLIRPLDDWVLRRACSVARGWRARGLPAVAMSVNLSGTELGDADLVRRIRGALRDSGLPPSHLELEITETAVVNQPTEALSRLEELRGLGVRVAIDDFGTGYSMLSRLQVFGVDKLKIDKSFVNGITLAIDSAPLVAAIIAMGHGLGLRVVAEGVETPEQLAFLRAHGCDEVQGYLISQAATAAAFEDLLRRSAQGEPMARWAEAELSPREAVSELVGVGPDLDLVLPALLTELERLTGLERACVTDADGARRPGFGGSMRVPIALPGGPRLGWIVGDRRAGVTISDLASPIMRLFGDVIALQITADRAHRN